MGAVLVVHYMAEHGGHVARAVLGCPGSLDPASSVGVDFGRLPRESIERHRALVANPKVRAVRDLLERGDLARARPLMPEAELDAWNDEFIAAILPGTVCDPARAPSWPGGAGWWAWMMTNADVARRARLDASAFRGIAAPVLILRGECDYVPESAIAEYRRLLPAAQYVPIAGAGHLIHVERPDVYTGQVRAFLDAEPIVNDHQD